MLYTDQINRKININFPPQRIISLVPSQTELLFELGLEENIIGITKFCDHPSHLKETKKIIGGTKNFDIEKIISLQPDLIIANKEENELLQIESLSKHFPVWVSDIKTFDDALEMIKMIGEITSTVEKAHNIVQAINDQKEKIPDNRPGITCIYLIWKDPFMTIGGDTFINEMLAIAGFENLYSSYLRYPEITIKEIAEKNPQALLLSSEPYPFKEQHITELKNLLPNAHFKLVDGEMFSWYGSRMQLAFDYFIKLYYSI